MKKVMTLIPIVFLIAFALLTLFLSSSLIFDWFEIRVKEGNYVLIVVWANFLCSLLYLFSAYGFIMKKKWTFKVLIAAALILILALIGLFIHIYEGGLFETKTIWAMFFRITITLGFALLAYLQIVKLQDRNTERNM